MGLLKRKQKNDAVTTCPECCQILEPGELVCPMCGHDMRPPAEGVDREGRFERDPSQVQAGL
jgi:hypothetical protein